MAIRQYIGARYVPRFTGTYDPTQIYEALDVVDNGSGTSYIARKNVPAGTPLTDTDYWFVYGASSGAIIALQNDMIQAQNDILTLQGAMTTAQGAIVTLQGNVSNLLSDVGLLTNKNRRYVLIADSFGTKPTAGNSWQSKFESIVSPNDVYKLHEGSMGFVHAGSGGHTAETLLAANSASISDHDTISDIVVLLGGNDVYYNETLASVKAAISSLYTYVRTNYPNATLWLGYCNSAANFTVSQVYNHVNYIDAESQFAISHVNCKFVDGVQYIMHDPENVDSDLAHPVLRGSEYIGYAAAYVVLTGLPYRYYSKRAFSVTPVGSSTPVTGGIVVFDGPEVTVYFPRCEPTGSTSFTGASYSKIGTLSDIPIFNGNRLAAITPIASTDANAPYGLNISNDGLDMNAQWYGAGTRTLASLIVPSVASARGMTILA